MIYRHTIEQVDAYFELSDLNQSSLKVILEGGMQAYLTNQEKLKKQEEVYEEKQHFIIGGAVDTKITMSEEAFKEKYHISDVTKKPGEGAMKAIKRGFALASEQFPLGLEANMSLYKKYLFEAANIEEFNMRSKNKDDNPEEDGRVLKFIKDHSSYWVDLVLAEGKQLLSEEEVIIIDAVYNSITGHPNTRHLFSGKKIYTKEIDVIYQFPLRFTFNDVPCKGMLDMIVIDHTSKRIMPIDIKTLSDYALRFTKAMIKRRYDLQASFYDYGLRLNLTQLATLIDAHLIGYTIAPFAFIAESTLTPGCPLIYITNQEILEMGRRGYVKPNSEIVGGWEQAIITYKQWAEKEFDINKIVEHGMIFLNKTSLFNGYENSNR